MYKRRCEHVKNTYLVSATRYNFIGRHCNLSVYPHLHFIRNSRCLYSGWTYREQKNSTLSDQINTAFYSFPLGSWWKKWGLWSDHLLWLWFPGQLALNWLENRTNNMKNVRQRLKCNIFQIKFENSKTLKWQKSFYYAYLWILTKLH